MKMKHIIILILITLFSGCAAMDQEALKITEGTYSTNLVFNTQYYGFNILASEKNKSYFRGSVDKTTREGTMDLYMVVDSLDHARWDSAQYTVNGAVITKELSRAGGYTNTDVDCSNQYIPCVYSEHLVLDLDREIVEAWAKTGVALHITSSHVEGAQTVKVGKEEAQAFLKQFDQALGMVGGAK